jgi:hypothetical protein
MNRFSAMLAAGLALVLVFAAVMWGLADAKPAPPALRAPSAKVALAAVPQNLVSNPGFEQDANGDGLPDGWSLPEGMVAWDDAAKHGGGRSLRFTNASKETYRLITQELPLKPGQRYHFSAWVRGENVRDGDPWNDGAGICMEWHDAQGKWLGGSYPSCSTGTFDWAQVSETAGPLPEGVAGGHVVLYLRRSNTGTAWFDDVVVQETKPPLLRAYLLSPAYRGELRQPTAGAQVRVAVDVARREHGLEAKTLRARLAVGGSHGSTVGSATRRLPPDEGSAMLTLTLPDVPSEQYPALEDSAYEVEVGLFDNSTLLAGESVRLRVLPPDKSRRVYVDDRQRLIVDGKPFFPLGFYLGPTEDEHLARISAAGFNTILCYGYGVGADPEAYMERAQAHGLKVIYSIKDFYEGSRYFPAQKGLAGPELARHYVTKFRNHAALLAWYINDELHARWLPRLAEMYDLVRELDPDHPAFQVLCRPDEFAEYYGVTDILGVDPYPVPRQPVSMVTDWMATGVTAMRRAKPVWVVPQVFKWSIYSGKDSDREPTFEEKRCMAFLGLIGGARGIIFYSYYDLFRDTGHASAPPEVFARRWDEVSRIAADLRKVIPAALDGTPVEIETTGSGEHVRAAALRLDGRVYLIAANTSADSPQALRAALPVVLSRGAAAARVFGKGEVRLTAATLEDLLAPLAAEAYVIGPVE